MLRDYLRVLILSSVGLFSVACMSGAADEEDEENEEEEEGGDLSAADDMCMSGLAWVGGDTESTRMHPGRDCLACHADRGEAEEVVLGGTVYAGANELDECYGVAGVVLELTDADGVVHTSTSNEAGNFVMLETSIPTPYSAKLKFEGRERVMAAMQTELSCNSCHTETGANGAPGRILAP